MNVPTGGLVGVGCWPSEAAGLCSCSDSSRSRVAHSGGPLSQEWAVAHRLRHASPFPQKATQRRRLISVADRSSATARQLRTPTRADRRTACPGFGPLGRTNAAARGRRRALAYALLNVKHDVRCLHVYASGFQSTSSTTTPDERRPASHARTRKYSSICIASEL
jgi:hypothetical protein